MDDRQAIIKCFRAFVEGCLVEQNIDAVMELFTDDLMGIGMGAQGIVRCKEDARPILSNNKGEGEGLKTAVSYSNLQVRCYGQAFGSICAELQVVVKKNGERSVSRIGQCASLRKVDGAWKIYMLQATPLSVSASELEAYPLSFAEDELEKYRMQEQLSEVMRQNTMAVYKINFTDDIFEQYISMDEYSIKAEKGDKYEKTVFRFANAMLNTVDQLRFIETFSLGNIFGSFQNGKHELTLDYESFLPDGVALWLRSIMRFYPDQRGQLKGYLYLINIDQQKRAELDMLRRAETDSMTGLLNKETVRKKVNELIQWGVLKAGAFFMLDLDCFKLINDTFGHCEGDRVIRETAAVLKSAARQADIVGRLGGDEFGVFYTGAVSEKTLSRKAEIICEMVRQIRPADAEGASASCSIGIAVYRGERSFEELYQKADQALYTQKKELGRNGYTFYGK